MRQTAPYCPCVGKSSVLYPFALKSEANQNVQADDVQDHQPDSTILELSSIGYQGPAQVMSALAAQQKNSGHMPITLEDPCRSRPIKDFPDDSSPERHSARLSATPSAGMVKAGRPFDIYVEFGLGARILGMRTLPSLLFQAHYRSSAHIGCTGLYGTAVAREVAQGSPLCRAYADRDEIARARARLSRFG